MIHNLERMAQQTYGGFYDAFVAKLDSTLTNSSFQSTYLGGSGDDRAFAIAISSTGDVYVAGYTYSPDFPNTSGGAQQTKSGSSDAFVAKLDSTLTNSSFQSTYLGGSGDDRAYAIAIDSSGRCLCGGIYPFHQLSSPHLAVRYDTQCGTDGTCNGSANDVFVSKLSKLKSSSLPQPSWGKW
jgi:hypothetical protein